MHYNKHGKGVPRSTVVTSAATKLEGPGSNPGSVESCSHRRWVCYDYL